LFLGVELRQFEHFLAVVEEGSFTRAAARVFMVQSSLSASLLALERELGTELFIRGRRGTELTDAGQALIAPARAALEHADRARDAVAEVRGLLRGSVRIAALGVPRGIDLVEPIARFRKEHPGVEFHLLTADAKSMADLVADGQVDFAVMPWADRMGAALHFEPLISTRLALVCPAGHRLAGAREVDPRDLGDEAIIDLPQTWQARELFDRVLQQHGVDRQVSLEVHDWLTVFTMVRRGLGISYGPGAALDEDVFGGVEVATLAGAPLWELGIVTRDDSLRGAAGRAFLTSYLEYCASTPECTAG
jgi:DNA-binding transcriptional LysR family regulator